MLFVIVTKGKKTRAVKDAVRYEQKNKYGLQLHGEPKITFLGERRQLGPSLKILVTPKVKHRVLKVSLFSSLII